MLYHAWIRRTAYANHIQIIVPVSIMLSYTAWVLYSAKRHKRKMILLRNATSLNSVECGRDSFELNSRGEASTTNRGKSSVRCTHVNELASLAKTRRKLPRQQSTLTPECVKEYTHKRRLSLDPAVTKVELDKVLHPSHQKKAKSSKAAKSCKNQGLK
ncbi:uncharacterized protein LOC120425627 [Culex pipiens pallens]|nr:uncharacterized protein LOC120425627 [Culex pipiens pallens]